MVIFAAIAAATVFSPISAHAGEPIKAEVGTDIVSSYLWRGSRLDGPALQPTVGLEWNGEEWLPSMALNCIFRLFWRLLPIYFLNLLYENCFASNH